jgi:hypothetical protein
MYILLWEFVSANTKIIQIKLTDEQPELPYIYIVKKN